jgi:hypothetical protein
MLKPNPEMTVEIQEQIIFVQNFTMVLMTQRPDWISYRSGDIRILRTGKIGKYGICPPTLHRFSRSRDRIKKKKTNCKKMFLLSSSIEIQKDLFFL